MREAVHTVRPTVRPTLVTPPAVCDLLSGTCEGCFCNNWAFGGTANPHGFETFDLKWIRASWYVPCVTKHFVIGVSQTLLPISFLKSSRDFCHEGKSTTTTQLWRFCAQNVFALSRLQKTMGSKIFSHVNCTSALPTSFRPLIRPAGLLLCRV